MTGNDPYKAAKAEWNHHHIEQQYIFILSQSEELVPHDVRQCLVDSVPFEIICSRQPTHPDSTWHMRVDDWDDQTAQCRVSQRVIGKSKDDQTLSLVDAYLEVARLCQQHRDASWQTIRADGQLDQWRAVWQEPQKP